MIRWLAAFEEEGEVLLRIGREEDLIVAEWPGRARLEASRDGSRYRFEAAPEANPLDIAKLKRGSVELLLRHLRGQLSFHGAAVARGEVAVVLLGRAGGGKSTLAAALCRNANIALLADDAVFLEPSHSNKYHVMASEDEHWLKDDAHTVLGFAAMSDPNSNDKRPVRARMTTPRATLRCFVLLTFNDALHEPKLQRLSGIDAIGALIPQAVRFVLDEPETNRRELEVLGTLVHDVPVFELQRPRLLQLLSRTCECVTEVMS